MKFYLALWLGKIINLLIKDDKIKAAAAICPVRRPY